MSTSPVMPTSSLGALAVVEVLTARALDRLGAEIVATPSPPEPAAAQSPPQPPAAIAQATLQAASQQGGSAPLFADLAAVVQSSALPQAVVAAAQQVLALVTPLDPPPSAADLKAALGQSGLLLEAHLAAGEPPAADLKAALLNLQHALQAAVEQEPAPPLSAPPQGAAATPVEEPTPTATPTSSPAPEPETPPAPLAATAQPSPALAAPPAPPETTEAVLIAAQVEAAPTDTPAQPSPPDASYPPAAQLAIAPASAGAAPAPPFPDGPVRAQAPAVPAEAVATGAPQALAAHRLLEDTGAALARQVLFQLASAPATQHVGDPNNLRWLFELPLATPQGTAIAQFEIDRDGGQGGGQAHPSEDEPAWRARFSLDLGDMGPVHAQVSLGGGRAGVSLWAEKPETAQALRAGRGALAEDFKADAVDADVAVFFGQPPSASPRAGRLLDQAL